MTGGGREPVERHANSYLRCERASRGEGEEEEIIIKGVIKRKKKIMK